MNPTPVFANATELLAAPTTSFALRHSRELPTYYELGLEDADGTQTHWVVPLPLKYLARRPVLLWRLADSPRPNTLACVDTGPVQLMPAHLNTPAHLEMELAHGLLRLNFNGQLLRGYYRLDCLPTGCGQLWQLTPIGCA